MLISFPLLDIHNLKNNIVQGGWMGRRRRDIWFWGFFSKREGSQIQY